MAVGAAIGLVAAVIKDYDSNGKIFDGDIGFGDYAYNMSLGGFFGGVIEVFGFVAGVLTYGSYVTGEMIGINSKLQYIRHNNISELSKMSETELLLEWELHNIAYYLDVFGMLRKHSSSVDFG